MHYLHACYHTNTPDSLFFFGEDPEHEVMKKRGRKPRTITSRPHPYALSHEIITASLTAFCNRPFDSEKTTITLNLPARGDTLLFPHDDTQGDDIIFIPVQYPAISVPLSHLTHLLPSMGTNHLGETMCRDSITFFQYVFGFALECISREDFFPGAGGKEASWGKWKAFLSSEKEKRVHLLAQAMPGLCMAMTNLTKKPYNIVKTFIDSCIDAVIKEACRQHPLKFHGRTKTEGNPAVVWLQTLWGESNSALPQNLLPENSFSAPAQKWLAEIIPTDTSRPF